MTNTANSIPGGYAHTVEGVSCHDIALAGAHVAAKGGQVNVPRSTVTDGAQQCAICHGAGRVADIIAAHAKSAGGR